MMQVTCQDIATSMPAPLRTRVEALIVQRTGEDVVNECDYVARGASIEEVLELATEHVKTTHTLRSWPPEFWVHLRARIHEV